MALPLDHLDSASRVINIDSFFLVSQTAAGPLVTDTDFKTDEDVNQMLMDESQPASSLHKSTQESDMNFETLEISSLNIELSVVKNNSSERENIPRHLSKSLLGKKGSCLTDFMKQQGENPPLETINLRQYSMPGRYDKLLQFTSTCRFLWQLDLSRNAIGDNAGMKLAESIASWGEHTQLKELVLIKCPMSERVWAEILKSLSSCNNLSHLDLSDNAIGKAGHYLAQSIKLLGKNLPLRKLFLERCLLPKEVFTELLQVLSSCK